GFQNVGSNARWFGAQDGTCAGIPGREQINAKAEGEKQPCHGESPVILGQTQPVYRIQLRANRHVLMRVRNAFGLTGSAAWVIQCAKILAVRGRGSEFSRFALDPSRKWEM